MEHQDVYPVDEVYEKMESCIQASQEQGGSSLERILELLKHENWRVRYAAAIALEQRRDLRAVAPLLEMLRREDQACLYNQPELSSDLPGAYAAGSNIPFTVIFPEGTTDQTKEAWRRRGRLKQAVCYALGNIGAATPEVLGALHRLAVDQKEDYAVRAAANKALGRIGSPESMAFVEAACSDEEWCTRTEAKKALWAIREKQREKRGQEPLF